MIGVRTEGLGVTSPGLYYLDPPELFRVVYGVFRGLGCAYTPGSPLDGGVALLTLTRCRRVMLQQAYGRT